LPKIPVLSEKLDDDDVLVPIRLAFTNGLGGVAVPNVADAVTVAEPSNTPS